MKEKDRSLFEYNGKTYKLVKQPKEVKSCRELCSLYNLGCEKLCVKAYNDLDNPDFGLIEAIFVEVDESGNYEKGPEMKNNTIMKCLQKSNAQIGELIEENFNLREELKKRKEQESIEKETGMKENEIDYKKLYEEEHKKYDEAIKRGLDYIKQTPATEVVTRQDIFEAIFPELKESEDEKIRKALIKYLEALDDEEIRYGVSFKEMRSWLEKQGHDGKKWIYEDVYLKEKEQVFQDGINEVLENPQKYGLKKEVEQKSTDTPKFKVGDWITNNTSTFQIVRVENEWYYADDGDKICFDVAHQYYHLWTISDAKDGDVLVDNYGNILLYKEISSHTLYHSHCYGNERLFIEQEGSHMIECTCPATEKQSDVLFQKIKEAGYEWNEEKKELRKIEQKPEIKDDVLSRFAFYQYDDDTIYLSSLFVRESDRGRGYGSKVLKAAEEVAKTFGISKIRLKVERNTWMERWYEKNGYEYLSSEGKYNWLENRVIDIKPNKIEQKPSTSVTEFDTEVERFCKECFITDTDEKGKVFCIARHFADWQKNRKNPTWSEEDEIMINSIIKNLDEGEWFDILQADWLKSLKDRVQLQAKQEWSEEDEEMFDAIIADILFTQKAHPHEANQVIFEREIDWLKSLKERMIWRPTEEQMKALNNVITEFDCKCGAIDTETIDNVQDLYEDLKKL